MGLRHNETGVNAIKLLGAGENGNFADV